MGTNKGYVYGVDVWEGSLDVDEGILKEAGVEFVIVRLNDIRGGHKVDKNFVQHWAQADQFIRWPYFVYNPWVSGKANFEFLAKTAPDCGAVSIDIEVRYEGYSTATYAAQVEVFLELAEREWLLNIYSGHWFLPYLCRWPANHEYWWAQYPYALYPSQKTRISWPKLIEKISALKLFPVKSPGPCRLRQVTADRYILPGCADRPIDINVWNGTVEELRTWANGNQIQVSYNTWEESIDAWARTLGYRGPTPTPP